MRELTKLLLQVEGCFVIEATNGLEAIETALVSRPDLILLDIQMPLMDGLQVTRVLRQNAFLRNVPIVAVTASDDKRRAAIKAGCDDCLSKPLLRDAINDLLARYLQNPDQERLVA